MVHVDMMYMHVKYIFLYLGRNGKVSKATLMLRNNPIVKSYKSHQKVTLVAPLLSWGFSFHIVFFRANFISSIFLFGVRAIKVNW